MREVIHDLNLLLLSVNLFIGNIHEGVFELDAEESFHCAKVLRMKAGQIIRVTDGKGNAAEGTLERVHEKECSGKITLSLPAKNRNHRIHLAIAPTKQNERMEWMLEKCVETGIDEVSFIRCDNSERVNLKTERMRNIVRSAVKQSLQSFIPKVNELTSFETFIADHMTGSRFIAHCAEGERLDLVKQELKGKDVLIVIGPEGDFSPKEIQRATAAGFVPVSLGEHRLRTETAGLYVCHALAILNSL